MIRLFIADDEEITRSGLVRLFDWSKLQIEVVGEAADGVAALSLLEELQPDILFTDVKMPRMDGIALAARAKALLPNLKVVFISGYREVDDIRSALKMGAFDYILKPVDYEELEQCFRGVLHQIEEEQASRLLRQNLEHRLSAGLHTMQAHLLSRLLQGQAPTGGQLEAQLDCLQLHQDTAYSTAVVILTPDEQALRTSRDFQDNWALLSVALKNMSLEIIEEYFQGYVLDDPLEKERLALILVSYEERSLEELCYEMCVRLQGLVKQYLGLSTSMGIGRGVRSFPELSFSYESAGEALKHRLYLGGGSVISYDIHLPADSAQSGEGEPAKGLRALLLQEEEKPLEDWIDSLFNNLAKLHSTDITFYRSRISRYVFEAYSVLLEQLGGGEEGEFSRQSILDELFHSQTLEQMRRLVWEYCFNIRKLVLLKNASETKGMIQRVQKIIREQYGENLTVSDLAAAVYLTPTYLCLLFRQATGVTINHYQTEVRMEKAKELLADLSNKLYDVSYAVGYMNPSYFSRQFKKYTGCLPSEYRDKIMAKDK